MAIDVLTFDTMHQDGTSGPHYELDLTFAGSDTSGHILSITGSITGSATDTITKLDPSYQNPDNLLGLTFPFISVFSTGGIAFDTQSGAQILLFNAGITLTNNQTISTNPNYDRLDAFDLNLQVDVTPVQLSVSVPLANANQHPSVPYGTPFAGVVISDASTQTETVTITGAAVMPHGQSGPPLANLLIDPNWATDGGHFTDGGTYVFTGSLAAVNTDLNALQVLPFGHAINLQVSVTDAAGATAAGDHPISILGISTDHPPVHV